MSRIFLNSGTVIVNINIKQSLRGTFHLTCLRRFTTFLLYLFKGIVSRDFPGLQVNFMDRSLVFRWRFIYLFIFYFSYRTWSSKDPAGKAFINALSKSLVFYRWFYPSPGLTTHRRSDLKLLGWCNASLAITLATDFWSCGRRSPYPTIWWSFFSAFSKIPTKRTCVRLLFLKLNQSQNTKKTFWGSFLQK